MSICRGLGRGGAWKAPACHLSARWEMTEGGASPGSTDATKLPVTPPTTMPDQEPPTQNAKCLARAKERQAKSPYTRPGNRPKKRNPKPGHKSRLEPPPTPSNPPINQPQKDGADSSVAPPSPQLDIVSSPDTFPTRSGLQRTGLGRPVPGSRQTGPQPTAHPWGAEGPGVLRSNQTHQRVLLVRIGWGVWF